MGILVRALKEASVVVFILAVVPLGIIGFSTAVYELATRIGLGVGISFFLSFSITTYCFFVSRALKDRYFS